ncbi:MAG: hypothetical protein PHC68_18765 [Syntrophorhabdaceae bacterium]|nr:hypothetical protein [Syntrophorhabdaceae bacterium]
MNKAENNFENLTDENMRQYRDLADAVTKYARFLFHERNMNTEEVVKHTTESCHNALMNSILGKKV